MERARNITFAGCSFAHLGGVYALGVAAASSDVVVSNCSFTDVSGGGVKLGSAGERGAPAPPASLAPELQEGQRLVSSLVHSYLH